MIPKGIFKNLSFHLSGNFKDKVFRNIDNRLYDPALWLMDAGIFYTIKNHVTLALNVNNLFDKEYFERTTILGKPRNYQASFLILFRDCSKMRCCNPIVYWGKKGINFGAPSVRLGYTFAPRPKMYRGGA